jgi:hypothetical protein
LGLVSCPALKRLEPYCYNNQSNVFVKALFSSSAATKPLHIPSLKLKEQAMQRQKDSG